MSKKKTANFKPAKLNRAPTESDVAKIAGVSQSAVSRAFTPGASVAQTTREKILHAAQSIGYQPNLLARSLATRRSNIIALAISNLENPFYAQVVKELSEQLKETGRHILLFTTPTGDEVDPDLERALSYQVDALVMAASMAPIELTMQCQKAGVPIVQINRETKLPGISTVWGENQRAGELVGAFLHAAGHKRYAFVAGTKNSSISQMRQTGYETYLKSVGVKGIKIVYGDYTFETAASAARSLLVSKSRPDAIFCASDYMAFAVIDVATREFNLNVPNDVSVIGVDNVPEAAHSAYDLTSFSQPAGSLVEEAINIIDKMIANPERRAIRCEVAGELIVRGSARKPEGGFVNNKDNKIWLP